MGEPLGLYGHIQHNVRTSRWMIAGFIAATCVCWILCNVSFNVGFRKLFGEENFQSYMGEVRGEGPAFVRVQNIREQCAKGDKAKCQTAWPPRELTVGELARLGVTNGLQTIAVPLLGVLAWLALFWAKNCEIVSWATGSAAASRTFERRLYTLVENLSIQLGQPMPRLEIIESDALNAFAAGLTPKDSMIGVTRGLLDRLNDRELEAVLAHEYTHILNGDSRVMVTAAVFVGIFEHLFYYFLSGITGAHETNQMNRIASIPARIMVGAVLFAPLCLSLALCWVPSLLGRAHLSRAREFMADAGAVEITKDPDALVSALKRIEQCEKHLALPQTMQALMISGDVASLLATHPPVEERIAALRAYAGATRRPKSDKAIASEATQGQGRAQFGQRRGAITRPAGRMAQSR